MGKTLANSVQKNKGEMMKLKLTIDIYFFLPRINLLRLMEKKSLL